MPSLIVATLAALTTMAVVMLLPGWDASAAIWLGLGQQWMLLNLGMARWFFAAIALLFVFSLHSLQLALRDFFKMSFADKGRDQQARRIHFREQLGDVCIYLFVGIGVLWTAIGMRDALQFALSPEVQQSSNGDPGILLRALVEGGILIALSTTIVGGAGSYLMKLLQTVTTGAALIRFHQQLQKGLEQGASTQQNPTYDTADTKHQSANKSEPRKTTTRHAAEPASSQREFETVL